MGTVKTAKKQAAKKKIAAKKSITKPRQTTIFDFLKQVKKSKR